MKNTKLIAIVIATTTISAILADCYTDSYGRERCDGIVRNTGRTAGNVVEGTGEAAGTVVEGTGDVFAGTIGGLFGGRGVRERMDDRDRRRENRRREKKERDEARRNRNNRD